MADNPGAIDGDAPIDPGYFATHAAEWGETAGNADDRNPPRNGRRRQAGDPHRRGRRERLPNRAMAKINRAAR